MLNEILELTELAYKVNEETVHDVIINIVGHVKSFEIYGYINGFSKQRNITRIGSFYWDDRLDRNQREYTEIKGKLLELLGGKQ